MGLIVAERMIAVGIGVAAIIHSLTAKRFYPASWGTGDRAGTIPKWFGRFCGITAGLGFIYAGLEMGSTRPLIGAARNPFIPTLGIMVGAFAIYEAYKGTRRRAPGVSDGERVKISWYQRAISLAVGALFIYAALVSLRGWLR